VPPSDIIKEIEKRLTTIDYKNNKVEIGFFGGNFTGLSIIEQKLYLEIAQRYIDEGKIKGIRFSPRPDYINSEILNFLKNYTISTIELGIQSFDDNVLSLCERNYSSEVAVSASKQIINYGFRLGMQIMIGLPGDNEEIIMDTAKKVIELKASDLRIYPTLVIKNTKLEKMFRDGTYMPLSINEAIEQTTKLILFFENTNINIIRVGLHPSENLITGKDIIAGPFHVSFRQLVMTKIWQEKLKKYVPNEYIDKTLIIETVENNLEYVIGYNSSNRNFLKQYYKNVKYKINNLLKSNSINAYIN